MIDNKKTNTLLHQRLLSKLAGRFRRGILLVKKTKRYLRVYGFSVTFLKIKQKLREQHQISRIEDVFLLTQAVRSYQSRYIFPRKITFSIIVPLYNTPEQFLREMIHSVQEQTYGSWELCMADGSDCNHNDVKRICLEYAASDTRIKYRKLEKNLGISGNTNVCLDMATGEYCVLFDHDDLLHPAALYEVMHKICSQNADFIYTDEMTFSEKVSNIVNVHYKADFSPDMLRSYNYICHLTVFSKDLLEKVGTFRSAFDGSQDYDMILRLTENAQKIVHIPKILYGWRAHANSVAQDIGAKSYALDSAKRALAEHLNRVELKGTVLNSTVPSTYRIHYEIEGAPLVSIIIPNKDSIDILDTCLKSIFDRTTYSNYEIIIVENNSTEQGTFDYYNKLKKHPQVKLLTWDGPFNYSAINNFGIDLGATGEYYLLLNNDIEVISPDWIQEMLMFAQRNNVGAVGAMLYYPDNTIQHAGVILGIGGVAGHSHKNFLRGNCGYGYRITIAQNLSAVTAACILIRRNVWDEVGGLNPEFAVAFNDVDLCMRIRKAGYLIVWTPYAELYHHESKTRGLEDTPEKQKRFQGEVLRFQKLWAKELEQGDPYYNPNLSLTREDFSLA